MNKYKGYVYDVCHWGMTIAWNSGDHIEYIANDWGGWSELWDMVDVWNVAHNWEDYKAGEVA